MSKRQCKKCKHLVELRAFGFCLYSICENFRDYLNIPDETHLTPKYCNKFEDKKSKAERIGNEKLRNL